MKKYYPILIIAIILILCSAVVWQRMSTLQAIHIEETERTLARDTSLIATLVTPSIKANEPVTFPQDIHDIRITLIDPQSRVIAETDEELAFLAIHTGRKEIERAQKGIPTSISRFSQTLNQQMYYHAVPIMTTKGTYVLRTAISIESLYAGISRVQNLLFSILFSLGLGLAILFLYLSYRIAYPLKRSLDEHKEIQRALNKRLKSQLKEKETLLKTMSEGVILIDHKGDVQFANDAAKKLLPIHARFNMMRAQIDGLPTLLSTGEPFAQECTCQDKTFYIQGTPVRDDARLITITDLTALRKLEGYRTDFVANVSHEIKTPLTCLMSATETLIDTETPADIYPRLYTIIYQQASRLNQLVQDILSLSELEKQSDHLQTTLTPTSLLTPIQSAIALSLERAQKQAIAINLINLLPTGDDADILADTNSLEQLLVNLIDNAIKYSKTDKIDLTLSERDPHTLTLAIQDYGIGIPISDQPRIFERFYRVDKARSRELGGTGLGLAIARHIATLHQGDLTLQSQPGQGTTFTLSIPRL